MSYPWEAAAATAQDGCIYGADARLLEFDIHYQRDEPGSRQEFRKAHP